MGRNKLEPTVLDDIQTYPLRSRVSKVTVEDFARLEGEGARFRDFIAGLPDILAARGD